MSSFTFRPADLSLVSRSLSQAITSRNPPMSSRTLLEMARAPPRGSWPNGAKRYVFSHRETSRFKNPWLGSVRATADTEEYSFRCGSSLSRKSDGRAMSASTTTKLVPTALRLASSRFSAILLFQRFWFLSMIKEGELASRLRAISSVRSVHLSVTRIICDAFSVCPRTDSRQLRM